MNLQNLMFCFNSLVYARDMDMLYNKGIKIRDLHTLRRVNKLEQNFWNQFWRSWNYGEVKEAALQAYKDMAEDADFKESGLLWRFAPHSRCNFESIVVQDQNRFYKFLKHLVLYNEPFDACLTENDLIMKYQKIINWGCVKDFDIIEEDLKISNAVYKTEIEEIEEKEKARKRREEERLKEIRRNNKIRYNEPRKTEEKKKRMTIEDYKRLIFGEKRTKKNPKK